MCGAFMMLNRDIVAVPLEHLPACSWPSRLRDHTNRKTAIGESLILAAPATTNDPVGSELAHARSETGRVALVWGQAA